MSVKSIAKAFGKAVLYWAGVWVTLTHIFVLWKWETYSVSPRSQQALLNQTLQNEQEPEIIIVDDTAAWTQILTQTRNALDTTEADLQRMQAKQAQLQASLQRMDQAIDNLVEQERFLKDLETQLPALPEDLSVFRDGDAAPDKRDVLHLTHLLDIPDLAQIDNTKDLQRAFALVSEAMETFAKEEAPQWSAVNQMLQQEFPPKRSDISACPVIPDDGEEDDEEKASESLPRDPEPEEEEKEPTTPAVTEEDVAARLQEIRDLWDALYEEDRALPVSDSEIKRLENARQRLVDEWMQRVRESLDEALDKVELAISAAQASLARDQDLVDEVVYEETEEDNVKCARMEDVLAVLEAGIKAIHRKWDLQEALRSAAGACDAELSDIILDADLPLEDSRPQVVGPATLRQYLDTALLTHNVPEWIHTILDAIGGHNDHLDRAIDILPENAGGFAVEKALDLAGQINFIELQSRVDRRFGGLKKIFQT